IEGGDRGASGARAPEQCAGAARGAGSAGTRQGNQNRGGRKIGIVTAGVRGVAREEAAVSRRGEANSSGSDVGSQRPRETSGVDGGSERGVPARGRCAASENFDGIRMEPGAGAGRGRGSGTAGAAAFGSVSLENAGGSGAARRTRRAEGNDRQGGGSDRAGEAANGSFGAGAWMIAAGIRG